jgi:hypothetical protein
LLFFFTAAAFVFLAVFFAGAVIVFFAGAVLVFLAFFADIAATKA